MRKIIVLLVALLLLASVAHSESMSLFFTYNSLAKRYDAPQFESSMITEDTDEKIAFNNENLYVYFAKYKSAAFNSASVKGKDSVDFIPCCVTAAFCLDVSYDNLMNSFGNILSSYLLVKGGEESEIGYFGGFPFKISRDGDDFSFFICDL